IRDKVVSAYLEISRMNI
ncbi:MAG: hypothetical protein E5W30_21725, partial [Mesorhizobium sp.]